MIKQAGSYSKTPKTSAAGSRYGKAPVTAMEQANQATLERETEIRSIFDEIIGAYEPGGSFGSGTEAMLERQKSQYLGSATQNLISSGMYGSTMTAGLGKKFEEEIGVPTRLKLEDLRTQAYTGALGQKAGFVERIEDQSPSFETLANLTSQAAAGRAAEPSLSDWLAQNFGVQGNPKQGATDAENKRKAAEERARNQKAQDYITSRQSSYSGTKMGTPIYGSSNYD